MISDKSISENFKFQKISRTESEWNQVLTSENLWGPLAKNEVFQDYLKEVSMKIQLHKSVSLWNHYKTDTLNHTQLNCSYFCLFGERIQINIKSEMGQVKYYFCLRPF